MSDAPPATTAGGPDHPRSLACLGDAGDLDTWSNIPYFLFDAARRAGFLTHALDLSDAAYRRHRMLWTAMAPLRLEGPGGYQYSRTAIGRMWDRIPPELRRGEIISHFQVFPPLDRAAQAGVRHSFYCDSTLTQLHAARWPGCDPRVRIGRRTLADTLRREGELYRSARFCIAMARATADAFVNDYGVDPAKVVVVRPGANLDETAVRDYLTRRGTSWREGDFAFTRNNPARLGFIGRDYQRKGLPRLVEAAEVLHSRGRPVRVTVIGHCPDHLCQHPLVEWRGLIHKGGDFGRFLAEVDSFAMGCLPSYAEPLGISTLECLRLGVPVMGAAVGGIPDCVPSDAGVLVEAQASGADIADAVEPVLFDEARYRAVARGAAGHMGRVTWEAAVAGLIRVWAGDVNRAGPLREHGPPI